MRELIHLFLCVLLVRLFPPTGKRRRTAAHAAPRPRPRCRPALPAHRSPYAREAANPPPPMVIDGKPLIRPYLLAYEREQQRELQAARRAALLLALDGIDVGPDVIHGMRLVRRA